MLYVIFNSDGSINTLVVGESINQGSNNVNQVFASVLNHDISDYSCVAEFELPNGNLVELSGAATPDPIALGDEEYEGYIVSLSEAVTYLAGNLKMNLKLIDIDDNVLCTYQITLKVNKTGYEPNETTITEAQYNALLESLNSYVLKNERYTHYYPIYLSESTGTLTPAQIVALNEKDVFIYKDLECYYHNGIVTVDGVQYFEFIHPVIKTDDRVVVEKKVRIRRTDYVYSFLTTQDEYLDVKIIATTVTLQTLLNTYKSHPIFFKTFDSAGATTYILSIIQDGVSTGTVEIEALSGEKRWYAPNIALTSTLGDVMTITYRSDYALGIKTLTANTTIEDLLPLPGGSLATSFTRMIRFELSPDDVYLLNIKQNYPHNYRVRTISLMSSKRWYSGSVSGSYKIADLLVDSNYDNYALLDGIAPRWASGTNYVPGDVVNDGEYLWINIQATNSEPLTNTDYWQPVLYVADLVKTRLPYIEIDTSVVTIADLVASYGTRFALIFRKAGSYGTHYILGVTDTHEGYSSLEIESLIGDNRYFVMDTINTATLDSLMVLANRQDYGRTSLYKHNISFTYNSTNYVLSIISDRKAAITSLVGAFGNVVKDNYLGWYGGGGVWESYPLLAYITNGGSYVRAVYLNDTTIAKLEIPWSDATGITVTDTVEEL